MNMIVAADANWGIGYKGNLLIKIPEDTERFKNLTLGGTVIMGRKTFESLPDKKPLKDRYNIVVSRDLFYDSKNEGITSVNNIDTIINFYKNDSSVFVIGGAEIYKAFIDIVDKIYVTRFHKEFEADTFFPVNLGAISGFMHKSSETKEYNGLEYSFHEYIRIN